MRLANEVLQRLLITTQVMRLLTRWCTPTELTLYNVIERSNDWDLMNEWNRVGLCDKIIIITIIILIHKRTNMVQFAKLLCCILLLKEMHSDLPMDKNWWNIMWIIIISADSDISCLYTQQQQSWIYIYIYIYIYIADKALIAKSASYNKLPKTKQI